MLKEFKLLMLTTLIISGCSICYELIISSVSSYLIGNSVLQYSITIGMYMCAMGLGSYLSKFAKQKLFDWFVFIELGVGFVGGISSLILFLSNVYLKSYHVVMYSEIITIGTLVGAEIPILTRIIEQDSKNLRVTISSIFSFDYLGGLIGSVAFPIILLPHLGYFATAFLVGLFNIICAILIIIKYYKRIEHKQQFSFWAIILFFMMLTGTIFSENISKVIEGGLYRDKIVYKQTTPYQHLVLTKFKNDLRLFIDGNIQFCSNDEYRYHEALVHIPMNVAKNPKEILILGGGDGMAVRELIKYDSLNITLVDLDREIIELCRTHPLIKQINQGALDSPNLKIVVDDAYQFLKNPPQKYDVIIIDLPDPNNEVLNKLYTNIFYRMCGNALNEGGVITLQSTSPYFATQSFWCINKTLESEGFYVLPYHLQVPSFGDWGFNIASKDSISSKIKLPENINTKYLDSTNIEKLFVFGKDEKVNKDEIIVNTLSKPYLIQYYSTAEANWLSNK